MQLGLPLRTPYMRCLIENLGRISLFALFLLAPACVLADSSAPPSTTPPMSAREPEPRASLELPAGYIAVPLHDIRDAMIYLGARASTDEMAALVYRELANDAVAGQRAAVERGARGTPSGAASPTPAHGGSTHP
jgi:hypothetical protein